jgi:hypothetical protein
MRRLLLERGEHERVEMPLEGFRSQLSQYASDVEALARRQRRARTARGNSANRRP